MNIADYTGLQIIYRLKTEAERMAYTLNYAQLHINYGDNVEWQRLAHQILLCDETRDYLYQVPGPVKYVKGTRPVLEAEVARVILGCNTDRERVLAILCFIRDLYLHNGKEIPKELQFYGGTEEVLIAKGENLCECVGRLMVGLCEIIGLPGRIVMHIKGHITCEIFLEGKWCYFDPRAGLFYVDENNNFLSIAELIDNREYMLNQPEWVKPYVSKQFTFEQRRDKNYNYFMTKTEINCFQYYSLMDAPMYNFNVKTCAAADADGLFVINKIYGHYIGEMFGEGK